MTSATPHGQTPARLLQVPQCKQRLSGVDATDEVMHDAQDDRMPFKMKKSVFQCHSSDFFSVHVLLTYIIYLGT